VSVFVGNGQALVINEQTMNLQTVQTTADPSRMEIVYQNNGVSSPIQQSSVHGGTLGAYLNFRDQSLEPATQCADVWQWVWRSVLISKISGVRT